MPPDGVDPVVKKTEGELRHRRPGDPTVEVMDVARRRHPLQPLVFGRDVDPADVGDPTVDDQQLAVVAQLEFPRCEQIDRREGPDLKILLPQKKAASEIVRKVAFEAAEAVEQHLDVHAGLRPFLQCRHESLSHFIAVQDERLHPDAVSGAPDVRQHPRIDRSAVAQHLQMVAVQGRIFRKKPVQRPHPA
ncbi:hypothetical protein SDC9_147770 [bioreactor metagenome]|uniref:Uncharacterized protein n=1 Tax=bioreactor metagenome TaxID=1076179 RepID=A0A645EIL3_9ZZZZ